MTPEFASRPCETRRLEKTDGVATPTLDRADRMNAFKLAMAREWLDAHE